MRKCYNINVIKGERKKSPLKKLKKFKKTLDKRKKMCYNKSTEKGELINSSKNREKEF